MEFIQRDYEKEKRYNNKKNLSEHKNTLAKKQIRLANNEYIDETHMEFIGENDLSFTEMLVLKKYNDFMKSKN